MILALHASSIHADSIARTPVEDARALMQAAIDSPTGEAHGMLVGPMAEAISRRFQSQAPITIDVSTQKRFAQSGCSRLKVLFAQDDVLLPGKKSPERRTIDFGINYCRDGMPPNQM
jgi:hypothetical protein